MIKESHRKALAGWIGPVREMLSRDDNAPVHNAPVHNAPVHNAPVHIDTADENLGLAKIL